jgi:DNA-binding NarL/FixJ family response regulator
LHNGCSRLLDNADLRILQTLSPRLRQTMEGLVHGKSDKEVASELDLSPLTVHGYRKTLYRRLGVSTRLELATRFRRMFPSSSEPSRREK